MAILLNLVKILLNCGECKPGDSHASMQFQIHGHINMCTIFTSRAALPQWHMKPETDTMYRCSRMGREKSRTDLAGMTTLTYSERLREYTLTSLGPTARATCYKRGPIGI